MVNRKAWFKEYRREYRKKEKELGTRYHSWEQIPGESFSEFKKRLTGKTV